MKIYKTQNFDTHLHLEGLVDVQDQCLRLEFRHFWKADKAKRGGNTRKIKVFKAEDIRSFMLRICFNERNEALGALEQEIKTAMSFRNPS